MNKAILPIIARLQALQTASQVTSGGARQLVDALDRLPLAALLREVNETVLGRRLAFASGAGPRVTLEVAGRRVLRLVAAEAVPNAESCLNAHVLEDTHRDDLIRILQAAAPRGHALHVTSQPIGRDGDEVSVGLPVALLADLLLVDLDTVPGTDEAAPDEITAPDMAEAVGGAALQRFARQVGPSLMAWLIVGGEADGASAGPEEMVSHLNTFLDTEGEALSTQLDRVSSVPGGAVSLVLGASLQDRQSTICARHSGGLLLGLLEGDTARLLPRAWTLALAKA